MGCKVGTYKRVCSLGLILTLLCTNLTPAATAKKLYSTYGQKLDVAYPEGVLETIQKYNDAKKYAYMYAYVNASEYDDSIIDNRIKDCKKRLKHLEEQLLAGIDLKLSEIYELENQYCVAKQQLDDALASKRSFPVKSNSSVADAPTLTEYKRAMQAKDKFETVMEIGNIEHLSYPVEGNVIPDDSMGKDLKLTTERGSTVTSLFNGTVIKTTNNGVTIDHGNGIVTKCTGLGVVTALKGDVVSQGTPVGLTGQRLTLTLMLNKKRVNVNKLFGEN